MMTAGIGGGIRHGSVALVEGSQVVGVCEQERVTRVRNAGFNPGGLPDEALDLLLQRLGRTRVDIGRCVLAETDSSAGEEPAFDRIEHHRAHASAAYLTSPFSSAAIVVCDHEAPKVSVWEGRGASIERLEWPWIGPGFADVYSNCARAFGLGDQRFEALARLRPDARDDWPTELLVMDGTSRLAVDSRLSQVLGARLADCHERVTSSTAAIAAAVQGRIGAVFLDFLTHVRKRTSCEHLCLAGSFFYHSSMNTLAKRAGLFADVFVPIDPGNAGLAVGAALHADTCAPYPVSPFLGPTYSPYETKEVLDNCKLQYSWESEGTINQIVVDALRKGRLVGWFQGAMEWGPRALGARSILANPFLPFTLENLNHFLKQREPWRGYALSGLEEAVPACFDGPDIAPFMECDYTPRDSERFAHALPSPVAAIRLHTLRRGTLPRFRRLLEAFGASVGLPFLVNTSFNGLNEPIVCSPRDAVRVFYGSGLDLLVIDQFVLQK
jgi:carbamoyltransferase